jgi:hypothetical protein
MRIALLAAGLTLGFQAAATAAPVLTWKHRGHSALTAAAKEAKQSGKRLLVGLAGSPT